MKKVLLTFIGTNDSNKSEDGAILTVLKKLKFDEIHLLWNPSKFINYFETAKYIQEEIRNRKYCTNVKIHSFECNDVTDHNEIYPKLLEFCKSIESKNKSYTAAIASGTPSMQTCWIIMAESGDFPLKLIRSDAPKYGNRTVREVKLGSALPRILRLENENKLLRKEYLPSLEINIKKSEIKIGDDPVNLSPVEFSYYRYFAERNINEMDYLRIDIDNVPDEFYHKFLEFHRESFPGADSNRMMTEKNKSITSSNFRANITKLNKKIKSSLSGNKIYNYYIIESRGERFRKSYGMSLSKEKIKIVNNQ